MKLPKITEAAFQRQVLDFAKLHGWRVAHFRPARTAKGWRTPVQADGKGFPDLVLVRGPHADGRPGRLVFAELKSETGKLSPEQSAWIAALCGCMTRGDAIEVYVWRPSHWPQIEEVLSRWR